MDVLRRQARKSSRLSNGYSPARSSYNSSSNSALGSRGAGITGSSTGSTSTGSRVSAFEASSIHSPHPRGTPVSENRTVTLASVSLPVTPGNRWTESVCRSRLSVRCRSSRGRSQSDLGDLPPVDEDRDVDRLLGRGRPRPSPPPAGNIVDMAVEHQVYRSVLNSITLPDRDTGTRKAPVRIS